MLSRSEFNNYGPPVKVWALGEDVTGVYASGVFHRGYPDHDNPDPAISIIRRPFAGYATWSGTSLASPRVTGLIAEAMTEHGITSPEEAARFVLTSPRAVPTENLPLPTGHDGQHVPLITHGIE